MFWSAERVAEASGGRWSRVPSRAMRGAGIDSRTIGAGQVFFALPGARADGHAFVHAAWERGASAAVVTREVAVPDVGGAGMGVLVVEDARKALGRLASAYREELRGRVIAVAGSNGKTTTKRLIEGVLRTSLPGTASPKSFNNDLGVPLTILNAREDDAFVLCEVGTNAPGETAALGQIVRPDVAVLTGAGREHLEGLGSAAGSAAEARSLCDHLRPEGVAVVNGDVTLLDGLACRKVRFGGKEGLEGRFGVVGHTLEGLAIEMGGVRFESRLIGRHNGHNMAAAVLVGREMGLEDAAIRDGLADVHAAPGRLEVKRAGGVGGVTVIDDSYNANPDSMLAALRTLEEVGEGRRVVVLGDMLELGGQSRAMHAELGEAIAGMEWIGYAVLVGREMRAAMEVIAQRWPSTRAEWLPEAGEPFASRIAGLVRAGDMVLVKGSRSMGMERVVERIAGAPDGLIAR